MISLPDLAAMQAALALPLDPPLHRRLTERIHDTIACGLEDYTHILIVEPGDGEADFIREAAFSPFLNDTADLRFGEEGFEPSWDWHGCKDGVWEIIRTVGNAGFTFIIFLPANNDIDPRLLALLGGLVP